MISFSFWPFWSFWKAILKQLQNKLKDNISKKDDLWRSPKRATIMLMKSIALLILAANYRTNKILCFSWFMRSCCVLTLIFAKKRLFFSCNGLLIACCKAFVMTCRRVQSNTQQSCDKTALDPMKFAFILETLVHSMILGQFWYFWSSVRPGSNGSELYP